MSHLSSLTISRHDYRTARKTNIHFIARELSKLGKGRFFSDCFSLLSVLKRDQRLPFWRNANVAETVNDGVEAYLWRTLAHPFKAQPALDGLMAAAYAGYLRTVPALFRRWVAEADVVLLESGGAEIYFDLVRQINPRCRLIYIASDHLDTIGASSFVKATLSRVANQFDGIRVPSPILASAFPIGSSVYVVPQGVDAADLRGPTRSPYPGGCNVVSVGNMLFDPSFFEVAAPAFPSVTFHVIGGGVAARQLKLPNVIVYGEMPFKETLKYIQHADAGIAPYDPTRVSHYLVDTSLKLTQYECVGLPAICPAIVSGDRSGRFGYDGTDPASIAAAVRGALAHGRFSGTDFLSWAEVAQRILHPEDYPDVLPHPAGQTTPGSTGSGRGDRRGSLRLPAH